MKMKDMPAGRNIVAGIDDRFKVGLGVRRNYRGGGFDRIVRTDRFEIRHVYGHIARVGESELAFRVIERVRMSDISWKEVNSRTFSFQAKTSFADQAFITSAKASR